MRTIMFAVAALVLVVAVLGAALDEEASLGEPSVEVRQLSDRGEPQRPTDGLNAAAQTTGKTRATGANLGVALRAPEDFVISGHAVPLGAEGIDLSVHVRCTGVSGAITEVRRVYNEDAERIAQVVQTITIEVVAARARICEVGAIADSAPRLTGEGTTTTPEAYVELYCPTDCVLIDPQGP